MDAKLTPSSITAQPKVELVIDVPSAIETESEKEKSLSSSLSLSPTNISTAKTPIGTLILGNFHVGYFKISLSLCSQALLWKTLMQLNNDDRFNAHPMGPFDDEHVTHNNLPFITVAVLWSLALFILLATSLTYLLKCFLLFHTVKEEFFHHVNMNYFFAPWTSALLLLQASPFSKPLFPIDQLLWWPLALPILILDLRIYGEWFTKGKRFLSRVANPASQHSVIANLVAARAYMEGTDIAVSGGLKDVALCMFTIGMAHYLVLFVTLYQRLPSNDGLPVFLRPVFFLFVATPSAASLAWGSVNGSFDVAAKMMFFLSLFLFISLVCRPTLFKNSFNEFSAAWWAYCFSLTLLAMASIEYAKEVKAGPAHVIMIALSVVSTLVLFVLLIFTVINANALVFGRGIEHDDDTSSTPDSSVNGDNGGTVVIK